MKVQGYKCDYCGKIYLVDHVRGIQYLPNMFDDTLSYTSCDPEKTHKHYCVSCANMLVITPADMLVDKGRDREKYDKTVKELFYILRKTLYNKK